MTPPNGMRPPAPPWRVGTEIPRPAPVATFPDDDPPTSPGIPSLTAIRRLAARDASEIEVDRLLKLAERYLRMTKNRQALLDALAQELDPGPSTSRGP